MHIDASTIEERTHRAIALGAERAAVEFKESQPFETLRYKIAKAALAMANRPDGGLIIVGLSQREEGKPFVLEGVDESVAATYHQETLYEFVNLFASPPIELFIRQVVHDGRMTVAISVSPSLRSPVICRKSTRDVPGLRGPDHMHTCDIYVRTSAPVGTARVSSAPMLDELIQRAAGQRAGEMIRAMRDAGAFEGLGAAETRFDQEVRDIADLF